MSKGVMYAKMAAAGVICCVGGPALMYYVTPSEEELTKRFNPDLRRRHEENKDQRQKDFDSWLQQLKEHSKSDKPIWVAAEEAQQKQRQQVWDQRANQAAEQQRLKDEIRSHTSRSI